MSDQDQDTEEPLNDSHQQLIPPFLLNQKVFTCNLEKLSSSGPSKSDLPQQNSDDHQYFEAVVRQVRHHPHLTGNGRWTFLIHFKGWNARYDRWMAASQLVADTPESRQHYEQQLKKVESKRQAEVEAQKQKQLAKKQRKQPPTAKPKTTPASAVSQPFPDDSLVSTLPFTLKIVLTEEWESINRRGYEAISATNASDKFKGSYPFRSVHVLPAAVTIRQLIKHFEKKLRKDFKHKQEKELQRRASQQDPVQENDNAKKEAQQQQQQLEKAVNQNKVEVRQFCSGLAKLFEEALPKCLLYAQERPQYQHYVLDKRERGEKVSLLDIYGCEFLLRLIVRLPILLMGKRPPSFVSDLIVVLQQSRTTCFKGAFRRPEYPHEWLDWEREYFGDPTKKKKNGDEGEAKKAAPDNSKESGNDF